MFLTNHATTQFHFFQTIHLLVDVEDDMCSVRDEYPSFSVQAMFLQRLQFLEEARHVDDAATSDDVDAAGVYKTTGEDMEIVCHAVRDDGVSGVVTALGAAADLRFVSEYVGELALAFVAPLGPEHNGSCHRENEERRKGNGRGGGWVFNCPWRSGLGRVSHKVQ